jgi:hypothetical protein
LLQPECIRLAGQGAAVELGISIHFGGLSTEGYPPLPLAGARISTSTVGSAVRQVKQALPIIMEVLFAVAHPDP